MASFERVLRNFNRNSAAVIHNCRDNLLSHQREALEALQQWFTPGSETIDDIAVVSMPTGSGKTGIICCLPYFIGGIQNGNYEQPYVYVMDKPVLVIAPDLEIADQLERQMSNTRLDDDENFLLKRGIVPRDAAQSVIPSGSRVDSTSKVVHEQHFKTLDIVIANAQKFLGEERGGRWEERLPDNMFKLVIVDEAHHHPATTWKRIIDKFNGHAKIVFFTATPFRADGEQLVANLARFAYELKRERAIREGIIRDTTIIEENQLPDFDEENWFRDILGRENQDRIKLLTFAQILIRARELQILKNFENPLPGRVPHMIMAITNKKKEADLLLEIWNNLYPQVQASVYHSQLSKYQLRRSMARLKNNELKLIIVCGMLLEGFDFPPISIAAIACNIGSAVRFAQFVGRAQRICRSQEGNEENRIAHIVTHCHFNQAQNYQNYVEERFAEI